MNATLQVIGTLCAIVVSGYVGYHFGLKQQKWSETYKVAVELGRRLSMAMSCGIHFLSPALHPDTARDAAAEFETAIQALRDYVYGETILLPPHLVSNLKWIDDELRKTYASCIIWIASAPKVTGDGARHPDTEFYKAQHAGYKRLNAGDIKQVVDEVDEEFRRLLSAWPPWADRFVRRRGG